MEIRKVSISSTMYILESTEHINQSFFVNSIKFNRYLGLDIMRTPVLIFIWYNDVLYMISEPMSYSNVFYVDSLCRFNWYLIYNMKIKLMMIREISKKILGDFSCELNFSLIYFRPRMTYSISSEKFLLYVVKVSVIRVL